MADHSTLNAESINNIAIKYLINPIKNCPSHMNEPDTANSSFLLVNSKVLSSEF